MIFKNITIIDENFEVKENMYVATKDDRIVYISDAEPKEDYGRVYRGEHRLLMPCFYNMHSHLAMSLMRGYGENLPLDTWLNSKIFPFEAHLTDEDMYYAELMGIEEMLRYGIGATNEMYLSHSSLGRALCESGVRANFSVCAFAFNGSDYLSNPLHKKTLDAIKDFDGYDNGRVKVDFSLHAEYTSNEKAARELAQAAADNGCAIHVHVSETKKEVEECRERHNGKSPVAYLADCGIFDVPAVAAHCVHVDDEDISTLKKYNVSVATCPKSNAKLSSGICPVNKLLDAGVNVAIGTDSVASNNNLNMIEEMRFFNLLQKSTTFDPTVITPAQTLFAATRAGAVAQRRFDCGLIKVGCKADIAILDTDTVNMMPNYNVLNNLIYSASGSDIVLTMVDGKVLYDNGDYPTLDTEKIHFETLRSRNRILGELANS